MIIHFDKLVGKKWYTFLILPQLDSKSSHEKCNYDVSTKGNSGKFQILTLPNVMSQKIWIYEIGKIGILLSKLWFWR